MYSTKEYKKGSKSTKEDQKKNLANQCYIYQELRDKFLKTNVLNLKCLFQSHV
jgi:hypothetical protein